MYPQHGLISKAVEDYYVLAIYTETYNAWYLCEKEEQTWKKGMNKGKYRVLVRMIKFDHLMGKYKDAKPERYGKRGEKSMYVLCDSSSIVGIVQKLDMY